MNGEKASAIIKKTRLTKNEKRGRKKMKCKILAAALALLMLLSACGRKKSNYKYNIPGYTGDT